MKAKRKNSPAGQSQMMHETDITSPGHASKSLEGYTHKKIEASTSVANLVNLPVFRRLQRNNVVSTYSPLSSPLQPCFPNIHKSLIGTASELLLAKKRGLLRA